MYYVSGFEHARSLTPDKFVQGALSDFYYRKTHSIEPAMLSSAQFNQSFELLLLPGSQPLSIRIDTHASPFCVRHKLKASLAQIASARLVRNFYVQSFPIAIIIIF